MRHRCSSNSRDGHSRTHDTREGSSQEHLHAACINSTPAPNSRESKTLAKALLCGNLKLKFAQSSLPRNFSCSHHATVQLVRSPARNSTFIFWPGDVLAGDEPRQKMNHHVASLESRSGKIATGRPFGLGPRRLPVTSPLGDALVLQRWISKSGRQLHGVFFESFQSGMRTHLTTFAGHLAYRHSQAKTI